MSSSDKWPQGDNGATTGVDKKALWGEHTAATRKANRFIWRLAHKNADLPEDDVDIRIEKGMGRKELIAVAGSLLTILAVTWMLSRPDAVPAPPPPAIQAPLQPVAQPPPPAPPPTKPVGVDILFWDQHGNPIDVPRRPKHKRE